MPYCPSCGYPYNEILNNKKYGFHYKCGWCKRRYKSGELLPK